MKNHASMEDILTMTPSDLNALPVDHLLLIQQEIVEQAAKLKGAITIYEGILNKKYSDSIDEAYKAKNDSYGKATFNDKELNCYVISVETPKSVAWNDDILKDVENVLQNDWKESPEEYITYTRKVPEATYNAWPNAIKKLFTPARSVKAGKRKISIKFQEEKD